MELQEKKKKERLKRQKQREEATLKKKEAALKKKEATAAKKRAAAARKTRSSARGHKVTSMPDTPTDSSAENISAVVSTFPGPSSSQSPAPHAQNPPEPSQDQSSPEEEYECPFATCAIRKMEVSGCSVGVVAGFTCSVCRMSDLTPVEKNAFVHFA